VVINLEYDTALYVEKLQKFLDQPLCLDNPRYLDLSVTKEVNKEVLQNAAKQRPLSDPLIRALGLILETMTKGPFELTRLGVNELLKSYLVRVQKENETACTRCYLDCICQLYLYSLLEHYPYTDLFWECLSQYFDTVSRYLIENKLTDSCEVFLKKVSAMGKCAAQKGLHTSSVQHFLHNMEVWAREEGFPELADIARNHRFNLETF